MNDAKKLGELMHEAWMEAPDRLAGKDLWEYIAEAVIQEGVGDEHHSLEELYDYRMLYNAHAVNEWASHGTYKVVKSRVHSDGEPCFGGGWFIVVAILPEGQIANHYREEFRDLFRVPETFLPPEYDGHTAQIAADRLRSALKRSH